MAKIKCKHIFIPVFFILLSSCKKDTKIIPPASVAAQPTSVTFNFNAIFNNEPLVYNRAKLYYNSNGDSLNVTKFNYYLSNISFKKDDGTYYKEPESYHIIKHDELSTTSFNIKNIPKGTYTQIEFLIGVDSTRNVSGAQSGALDPSYAMFWDWNTGYIFLKIEGGFKTISTPLSDYALHIGGFAFPNNNIKKCVFTLNTTNLQIEEGKNSTVYYDVTVDEIFKNPYILDLSIPVTGNRFASSVAINYSDIFTVNKIEN